MIEAGISSVPCHLSSVSELSMYNLISKIFDKLEKGLSPREKAIIVSLMLVISILGIVLAVRYYNYIQKNPEFCNSCHLMEEAYTAWKLIGSPEYRVSGMPPTRHDGAERVAGKIRFYDRPENA